jgi:hypothetical protein
VVKSNWFMRWLHGNRSAAAVLALILLAVPTFATLFPGWITRTDRAQRILVMVVWVAIAVATAIAAQGRALPQGSDVDVAHQAVVTSQLRALGQTLSTLLDPKASGIPASYTVTVSTSDGHGRLFPWYPVRITDPSDPRVFEYGQGATGIAFVDRKMTCAVGDGVSHETFGLTEAQRELFGNYRIVAAVPVSRVDGSVVGTLCLIALENDGTFVTTDGRGEAVRSGQDLLEQLADRVGVAFSDATELGGLL